MISKNQIKLIRSLRIKKYREVHGLFIAEGDRLVKEILNSPLLLHSLFATQEWMEKFNRNRTEKSFPCHAIQEHELLQISGLDTPPRVLCLVKIPAWELKNENLVKSITLALDDIRDPGNMGTIIRTAAWFGFEHIACSRTCVDVWNPKVVQSSAGAIARVKVYYTDLHALVNRIRKEQADFEIYGTFREGIDLSSVPLKNKALILLGNEARGISPELVPFITQRLGIPLFGYGESLNAAVAAGIICWEFRKVRR